MFTKDCTFGRCVARSQPRVHCRLLPPLQVRSSTRAPLAVDFPVTSRHRPDCSPVIVPLELRFHSWFAPPVQCQISWSVPRVVVEPVSSRHLPAPTACTSPAPAP